MRGNILHFAECGGFTSSNGTISIRRGTFVTSVSMSIQSYLDHHAIAACQYNVVVHTCDVTFQGFPLVFLSCTKYQPEVILWNKGKIRIMQNSLDRLSENPDHF